MAQSGIFNNASQHWNHNFFWEIMGPENHAIPKVLEDALTQSFGSVALFKQNFALAGASQFGSGWAWLVVDTDGTLKVTRTENGVNPLCFGQKALRLRCVGTQLLHRFPQQASGLCRQLPRQSGELAGSRRPSLI